MTTQITVIGLGQIGASIGLALAEHAERLVRVGHDRERDVAHRARELGAVDTVKTKLHAAVEGADLVLLCLPLHEIEETLRLILPDLRREAVVMDTAPIKAPVEAWFKALAPEGVYYVGLVPVIGPAHLTISGAGIEAARADLFKKGMMGIVAPTDAPGEAIKLASDLAALIGTQVFYLDEVESDSLMTAAHLLPQIMATTLLNATVDQPGWKEGRKLAGRAFTAATAAVESHDEQASLLQSLLLNRENALRVLETAIVSLQRVRDSVEKADQDDLDRRLEHARLGRAVWWAERQAAEWDDQDGDVQLDNLPGMWDRFMGDFSRRRK